MLRKRKCATCEDIQDIDGFTIIYNAEGRSEGRSETCKKCEYAGRRWVATSDWRHKKGVWREGLEESTWIERKPLPFGEKAACRGLAPSTFYPYMGHKGSEDSEPFKRAVAICQTCSVRLECLEYAIENEETEGVWGGTSKQRRAEAIKHGWNAEELLRRVG